MKRGHSKQHDRTRQRNRQLAIGLGWFSIGLGMAEILAPRSVSRLIGLADNAHENTLRTLGMREVAHGIAILAEPASAPRVWARVGGDALDLSVLGAAMAAPETDRTRLLAAMGAVLGVTALDVLCARQLGRYENGRVSATRRPQNDQMVRVERVVTVNKPVHEVYQFWHDFGNLPRFMRHLKSVERLEGNRTRWRAKGPAGLTVEWDAEMLQDRQDEWIAWRSVEGSDVQNSGSVRFSPAPGARGTEVRVQMQYEPPAGAIGRTLAKLFGEDPEQQIQEDLHRFKQLLETGEIAVSDGPSLWRAAQPHKNPDKLKRLAGVHS
jgi:uncharacterized membrane protein/uncharacterized protein YjeT (DUF2065 family)